MFIIWIVSPPNYLHSRCFEEVALGLQAAFRALGHEVPVTTQMPRADAQVIVLGANLLAQYLGNLPKNLIIYNLEQIQQGSPWLRPGYVELLKKYPVWDYSQRNIKTLKKEFDVCATHCPLGYVPELSRIPQMDKGIDVLFIGSLSDRRKQVLEKLAAKGIKVSAAFNSYGKERDGLIARAKIVLNIHYYEAQVFEIVRVSYLLANRVCVVSESGQDEQLEAPLKTGVAFAPYGQLVQRCEELLNNEEGREQLAQKGFECFSALSQVDMLKNALAA